MNQKQINRLTPFAALIALSASTAFAAGNTAPAQSQPAPRSGQSAAPNAGGATCVAPPQDGSGRPGRGAQGDQDSAPSGAQATGNRATGNQGDGKPAPMKTAPAPSATANANPGALDCAPMRPHRHGGQGQQQPGDRSGTAQPMQPGAAQPDAARVQTELSRVNTLLASTTNAKARVYLSDARTLLQSGDPAKIRAAQGLIRAAEAITGTQK
ncbi:hypothetical protein [Deinococcus sp.]|uniref:hypothetical protein n=1 Tax=Deinococcus sp. TaxID=47478 RepID=UPI003CC56AA2